MFEDSTGLAAIRAGTAANAAQAWTLALRAACTALLDGRARQFAMAVHDELPPSVTPSGA